MSRPRRRFLPWLPVVAGVGDVDGLAWSTIRHADGSPYIVRYDVVVSEAVTVRLHHWVGSDDQRAPHDHPWSNVSTVVAGRLVEHGPAGAVELGPGAVVARPASAPHWVELVDEDAWTVFTTGPVVRRWGFHGPDGWVHWSEWPYAGSVDDGSVRSGAIRVDDR